MPNYDIKRKKLSDLVKGTWDSSTEYTVGDLVDYQGSSYACIQNNTNQTPTNTDYWALIAEKGDQGIQGEKGDPGNFINRYEGLWSSGPSYTAGDIVIYNGSSWLANSDTVAGEMPGDSSKWDEIAEKGDKGDPGDKYKTSSTDTLDLSTISGENSITVADDDLAFSAGQPLIVAYDSDNFIEATVVSYSGTTLTFEVNSVNGSGSYSSWEVNVSGVPGEDGEGVPPGGLTGQGLIKSTNEDYITEWHDVVKPEDISLIGISLYLLDTETGGVKETSLTSSDNAETSISTIRSTAGVEEIARWTPLSALLGEYLPAGNYGLSFDGERNNPSRPYKVRYYFEIWEVDDTGADVAKIGTSNKSNIMQDDRATYGCNLALPNSYQLTAGNSIEYRVFVEFDDTDVASPQETQTDFYYEGQADSFFAMPVDQVVLDEIYASNPHGSTQHDSTVATNPHGNEEHSSVFALDNDLLSKYADDGIKQLSVEKLVFQTYRQRFDYIDWALNNDPDIADEFNSSTVFVYYMMEYEEQTGRNDEIIDLNLEMTYPHYSSDYPEAGGRRDAIYFLMPSIFTEALMNGEATADIVANDEFLMEIVMEVTEEEIYESGVIDESSIVRNINSERLTLHTASGTGTTTLVNVTGRGILTNVVAIAGEGDDIYVEITVTVDDKDPISFSSADTTGAGAYSGAVCSLPDIKYNNSIEVTISAEGEYPEYVQGTAYTLQK